MADLQDIVVFEAILQKFDPDSRLVRAWPLTGGVSAQVIALEYEQPDGQTKKAVVRQHGAADLGRNPRIAFDEFTLLQHLKTAGLAVPTPYAVDESGTILPTPYIVVEYIEGARYFMPPRFEEYSRQFATHLAMIHGVDLSVFRMDFLPHQIDFYTQKLAVRPASMDTSLQEERIRETLETVWPLTQKNPTVLLHGDFWPGNLLWNQGQIVGVIDWEDAALGDPLSDLGNTRLEILWACGLEAMEQFTEAYQSIMTSLDWSDLPYWDLCAALRPAGKLASWIDDANTLKMMQERHALFTTQAFDRLLMR